MGAPRLIAVQPNRLFHCFRTVNLRWYNLLTNHLQLKTHEWPLAWIKWRKIPKFDCIWNAIMVINEGEKWGSGRHYNRSFFTHHSRLAGLSMSVQPQANTQIYISRHAFNGDQFIARHMFINRWEISLSLFFILNSRLLPLGDLAIYFVMTMFVSMFPLNWFEWSRDHSFFKMGRSANYLFCFFLYNRIQTRECSESDDERFNQIRLRQPYTLCTQQCGTCHFGFLLGCFFFAYIMRTSAVFNVKNWCCFR